MMWWLITNFIHMPAWTQWLFVLPGSTPVRRRSSARPAAWGFRRRRGWTRTRGPSIQTDPERWAKTIPTNWEPWWHLINYTVFYRKESFIIFPSAKIPSKFLSENSLQGVRELGWPAAHVAAPQEPRGVHQVILLRLRQGVPHGFEQVCWISNFCPYQTIFISYNFPIDFDIPNLTEGTISENATRRSTSRRRSSRASFAASPSCRKSTWKPTRESTQERNRESFCPLDDYSNLSSQDSHLTGTPASIVRRGSSRGHGATSIKLRAKPGMHLRQWTNKFYLNLKQGWKNFKVGYVCVSDGSPWCRVHIVIVWFAVDPRNDVVAAGVLAAAASAATTAAATAQSDELSQAANRLLYREGQFQA